MVSFPWGSPPFRAHNEINFHPLVSLWRGMEKDGSIIPTQESLLFNCGELLWRCSWENFHVSHVVGMFVGGQGAAFPCDRLDGFVAIDIHAITDLVCRCNSQPDFSLSAGTRRILN